MSWEMQLSFCFSFGFWFCFVFRFGLGVFCLFFFSSFFSFLSFCFAWMISDVPLCASLTFTGADLSKPMTSGLVLVSFFFFFPLSFLFLSLWLVFLFCP